MYDLRVRGELVDLAGDPVVKTRAYRDNEIGIHYGVVGVRSPVHAEHPQ